MVKKTKILNTHFSYMLVTYIYFKYLSQDFNTKKAKIKSLFKSGTEELKSGLLQHFNLQNKKPKENVT